MARTKKQQSLQIFFLVIVSLVAVVVGLIYFNKSGASTSTQTLATEKQLFQKECIKSEDPIIDIHESIVNDADIAYGVDYWANDAYDQNIKVWQQGENTFCAEITFEGTYDAQPGKLSPGKKRAVLSGDEDGTIHGSTRLAFVGTLRDEPEWPTTGYVGTTDLGCDLEGDCKNYKSKLWYNKYFESIEQGYPKDEWHEWIYQNGDHQWINRSGGNAGEDIL